MPLSARALLLAASAAALAAPVARAETAAAKDLDEVVVTAAPYVVSIESTTTSVNVVKREQLDMAPPAGLGDVLADLPGVRSSFFGPGASRPVIRGLAGPRVQVLTNGVGEIDASGLSPDHQVASDPQEAERIEVLRGPSALAYGGSAIGGIVNIIDERVASTFRAGLHGRGLASYTGGDNGRQVSGEVAAGLGGRWMLSADGVHRQSDDYRVPVDPISARLAADLGLPRPSRDPAHVANSYSNLDAYGAGLSYVGEGGWGGLSVKRTRSDYGSPAEADVHIALKQTRLDTRGGFDINLGPFQKLKFAGGYADYTHTEFEGPVPGTTFLSKGEEGRVELVQGDHGGWQGAVGVQALHRNFDAIGEEALIPRTRIDEAGVFTLQRLDRDTWGVEGGLRVDRRKLDSLRGQRSFTNLSGSVGVFARPAESLFLGLSLSRTSRAPTEEELFSLGAHPATAAYEIGDRTLDREVSYSADASVHYKTGGWTLDLHGFYVDYRSYIDLVPTGKTDAASGFQVYRFVEGGATFYGTEAEAAYAAWSDGARSLTFEASGDYVHGTTDAGPAVRIPPWSAAGKAVYQDGALQGVLEVRRVGAQDRLAAFERPTDGYTLVNVSLVLRPVKADPDLKVFADVHNLFDVEAREHASFLKDVAPLPGRTLRVGLGYRF